MAVSHPFPVGSTVSSSTCGSFHRGSKASLLERFSIAPHSCLRHDNTLALTKTVFNPLANLSNPTKSREPLIKKDPSRNGNNLLGTQVNIHNLSLFDTRKIGHLYEKIGKIAENCISTKAKKIQSDST